MTKICEQVCFDCPFHKSAESLHLEEIESFEFVFKHLTEDGGYEPYHCEEQEGICYGQSQVIANSICPGPDVFTDRGEFIDNLSRNRKDFFIGAWDFMAHHEG